MRLEIQLILCSPQNNYILIFVIVASSIDDIRVLLLQPVWILAMCEGIYLIDTLEEIRIIFVTIQRDSNSLARLE
jgi:hypothetical protein